MPDNTGQFEELRDLATRYLKSCRLARGIDFAILDELADASAAEAIKRESDGIPASLRTIAFRNLLDHVRREHRRRRLLAAFAAFERIRRREDPSQAAEREEARRVLRETLARVAAQSLTPAERRVLLLRGYEELEPARVAEILRTSRASVDTLFSAAKRKLRAELQRHAAIIESLRAE